MAESQVDGNLVDQLAEDFVARRRRGEVPSLTEYTNRFPHLAEQIRDLFPALEVLEQFKPRVGDLTSDFGGAALPASTPALERLGDYRILREIGRGGMGVVYEAEQMSLGRRVAIKVLPAHPLSGSSLHRFLREAKAAAGLHHSNIVPVFGVGEDQGLHYYVMQFISGLGLDQVLDEVRKLEKVETGPKEPTVAVKDATAMDMAQSLVTGRFALGSFAPAKADASTIRPSEAASPSTSKLSSPTVSRTDHARAYWQSVAQIGKQAADAIGYAGSQGILHRDIKPSNLILDEKGTIWITDFGLAKAASGEENLTHAGDIVGTLRYMAPERFQGTSDVRGDLFSLGLTLYEMLTLRSAYDASDRQQLIEQIQLAQPPRPRSLRSSIPRDLETIVLKAIDRDSARRYQTGADMAEDLERFLEDRPILARRISIFEQGWRWARRNPLVAVLTASVASLLVVLAAGATVSSMWLRDERNTAMANEERAKTAESKAESERDQAIENQWKAYAAQARALHLSGQAGSRLEALAVLKKAAEIKAAPELRNFAAALLVLPDLQVLQQWEARDGDKAFVSIDLLARFYALSDPDGNLSIRNVADQQEIASFPGPGVQAVHVAFCPKARFLAVKYHVEAKIVFTLWDMEKKTKVIEAASSVATAFSPDGRWLAWAAQRNEWGLFDLTDGQKKLNIPCKTGIHSLAFSPGSDRVAVAAGDGVEIREVPAGRLLRRIAGPAAPLVSAMQWSTDGRLLAVGNENTILLHDLTKSTVKPRVLTGHDSTVATVTFARHGDWLVSTSWDGTTRLWDTLSGLCHLTARGFGRALSPDDKHLVYIHGSQMGVWELHIPTDLRRANAHKHLGERCISPDGRWLASSGAESLQLFEIASGKLIDSMPPGRLRGAAFAPDGQSIVAFNATGGYRWPLVKSEKGEVRLGPAATFYPRRSVHCGGVLTKDQRYLAVISGTDTMAWHDLERGKDIYVWKDHPRVSDLALSPDERWLASGTWNGAQIKIRDITTGELVKELPAPTTSMPVFSPNGKWLVACNTNDFAVFEVPSWKLLRTLPGEGRGNRHGDAVFSSDSKSMALMASPTKVRIVDAASGRELVTLEYPCRLERNLDGFTPDGSTLVGLDAMGADAGSCFLFWNLKSLRLKLREMNLDWEDP